MTNAAQQKDARRRSNDTLDQGGPPSHVKNRAAAYDTTRRRLNQNNNDDTSIQQTTKGKTSLNRQSSHYQLKELINKTVENLASKIKNCKDDKGIIAEAVDYDSTAGDGLSPYSTPFKKKKDSLRSSRGYNNNAPLRRESSLSSTVYINTPLKREGSVTSAATYSTTHRDSSGSTSAAAYNSGAPQKKESSVSSLSATGVKHLHKKNSSASVSSGMFTLQKKDSSITINDGGKDAATTYGDGNDNNQDENPDSGPTASLPPLSAGAVYVSTSF